MKILLALCLSAAVSLPTLAWAADAPSPSAKATNVVNGEVLEVKDVDIYTYLRLKTRMARPGQPSARRRSGWARK
jgi:hypothetical protein